MIIFGIIRIFHGETGLIFFLSSIGILILLICVVIVIVKKYEKPGDKPGKWIERYADKLLLKREHKQKNIKQDGMLSLENNENQEGKLSVPNKKGKLSISKNNKIINRKH